MKYLLAIALAFATAAHAQQSVNLCRGMTDQECIAQAMEAAKQTQKINNIKQAQRVLAPPPAANFVDHYEPRTACQPSNTYTGRDAFNAWAGVSTGPQGWDCRTVMVPVYR